MPSLADKELRLEGFGLIAKKAVITIEDEEQAQDTDAYPGLTIRGFASVSGMDRQLDDIDPLLFDVESFMKNPQLYYNHGYWMREDGNPVSAGRVDKAEPAEAVLSDSGDRINIVSLRTRDVVDSVPADDREIIVPGTKGLWTVATILEKGVADLVMSGRMNAFSWMGDLVTSKSGDESTIDLMEISVVFIPANSDALFKITKSYAETRTAYLTVSDNMHVQEFRSVPDDIVEEVSDVDQHIVVTKSSDGTFSVTSLPENLDESLALLRAHSAFVADYDAERILLLRDTGRKRKSGQRVYEITHAMVRRVLNAKAAEVPVANDNGTAEDGGAESGTEPSKEGGEQEMDVDDLKKAVGEAMTAVKDELKSHVEELLKNVGKEPEKDPVAAAIEDVVEQVKALALVVQDTKASTEGLGTRIEALEKTSTAGSGQADESGSDEGADEGGDADSESLEKLMKSFDTDPKAKSRVANAMLEHILTKERPSYTGYSQVGRAQSL